MRDWLIFATEHAVTLIDAIALATIVFGTLEAVMAALKLLLSRSTDNDEKRAVWIGYARWLVAGLTFQLAADLIETSIAPGWDDIGRLAAIAAIRTFLNYFLERDLAEVRERQHRRTEKSLLG